MSLKARDAFFYAMVTAERVRLRAACLYKYIYSVQERPTESAEGGSGDQLLSPHCVIPQRDEGERDRGLVHLYT